MSSKYQKQYQLPPSFTTIVKEFAREVLRSQPANIYEFGALYFEKLAQTGASSAASTILPVLTEALSGFKVVPATQLRDILCANLGLSPMQATYIIAVFASIGDEGTLPVAPFLKVSAKRIEEVKDSGLFLDVPYNPSMPIRGMSANECVEMFHSVFQSSTGSTDGRIFYSQLRGILRSYPLDLDNVSMNLFLVEAQPDETGALSYAALCDASHFLLFLADRFLNNT